MVYISLIFIDSAQLVGFWSYFANLSASTSLILFSTLSSTIATRSFMAGIFEVSVSQQFLIRSLDICLLIRLPSSVTSGDQEACREGDELPSFLSSWSAGRGGD